MNIYEKLKFMRERKFKLKKIQQKDDLFSNTAEDIVSLCQTSRNAMEKEEERKLRLAQEFRYCTHEGDVKRIIKEMVDYSGLEEEMFAVRMLLESMALYLFNCEKKERTFNVLYDMLDVFRSKNARVNVSHLFEDDSVIDTRAAYTFQICINLIGSFGPKHALVTSLAEYVLLPYLDYNTINIRSKEYILKNPDSFEDVQETGLCGVDFITDIKDYIIQYHKITVNNKTNSSSFTANVVIAPITCKDGNQDIGVLIYNENAHCVYTSMVTDIKIHRFEFSVCKLEISGIVHNGHFETRIVTIPYNNIDELELIDEIIYENSEIESSHMNCLTSNDGEIQAYVFPIMHGNSLKDDFLGFYYSCYNRKANKQECDFYLSNESIATVRNIGMCNSKEFGNTTLVSSKRLSISMNKDNEYENRLWVHFYVKDINDDTNIAWSTDDTENCPEEEIKSVLDDSDFKDLQFGNSMMSDELDDNEDIEDEENDNIDDDYYCVDLNDDSTNDNDNDNDNKNISDEKILDINDINQDTVVEKYFDKINPVNIKNYLDRTIVGQDEAKVSLSIAMANHLMAFVNRDNKDFKRTKETTLIIGPSGSGKTMIARCLSKYTGLPVAIVDASQLTADGWQGLNKGDVLVNLYSGWDREIAEYGILVLDEFDKMCKSASGGSYARRDQESVLGLLDGIPISNTNHHGDHEGETYETKNLLIILTGSFSEMTEKEKNKKNIIGFGSIDSKKENDIETRLIEFGIIPEIVGRITNITSTTALTEDQIVDAIMNKEESLLSQYKCLVGQYKKELVFDENMLRDIIRKAPNELGVRGVRNYIQKKFREKLFDAIENNKKDVCLTDFETTDKALNPEDFEEIECEKELNLLDGVVDGKNVQPFQDNNIIVKNA